MSRYKWLHCRREPQKTIVAASTNADLNSMSRLKTCSCGPELLGEQRPSGLFWAHISKPANVKGMNERYRASANQRSGSSMLSFCTLHKHGFIVKSLGKIQMVSSWNQASSAFQVSSVCLTAQVIDPINKIGFGGYRSTCYDCFSQSVFMKKNEIAPFCEN